MVLGLAGAGGGDRGWAAAAAAAVSVVGGCRCGDVGAGTADLRPAQGGGGGGGGKEGAV
jgi:hypothetical protein